MQFLLGYNMKIFISWGEINLWWVGVKILWGRTNFPVRGRKGRELVNFQLVGGLPPFTHSRNKPGALLTFLCQLKTAKRLLPSIILLQITLSFFSPYLFVRGLEFLSLFLGVSTVHIITILVHFVL